MRETFQQLTTYLWIIVHHRWLALISAIILCVIGWIVVALLPNKYEIETKVYFDTKTVLTPLLQGLAVDNTVKQETAMLMRRTLITRPNIARVITETDLEHTISNQREMDKLVDEMIKNISITNVTIPGQKKEDDSNIYSISYVDKDPTLAKKVVDQLLNIFVENILGASRKDSAKAGKFLDEQIKDYELKLDTAEEKVKLFKQKNVGLMPEDGKTYYSQLRMLETRLDEAKLSLREKDNHTASLKSQIQTLVSNLSASQQDSESRRQTPLEARIEKLQIKLDELQLQYTEDHPDVISTHRSLQELLDQQQEILKDSPETGTTLKASVMESKLYQDLNVLLSESEAEASALRARVNDYQQKIDEMNSKMSLIPKVEAEMTALDRNYSVLKNTYDELLQRKAAADLSRDAEKTGGEFQFNIVEPPRIPHDPASPDRLMLISVVMVASLIIGIAISWMYEQIRPTFYSRQQVEEFFSVPVLGTVSMQWSEIEQLNRRKKFLYFGLSFVVFLSVYLGLNLYYLDMDIDALISVIKSA